MLTRTTIEKLEHLFHLSPTSMYRYLLLIAPLLLVTLSWRPPEDAPLHLEVKATADSYGYLRTVGKPSSAGFRVRWSDTIRMTRYHSEATTELTPVVLFDRGSSDLSGYQQLKDADAADRYDESQSIDYGFRWDDIRWQKQREILDVIGFRYHESGQKLQIEGGYSAEGGETAELARTRAENVREYLLRVWKFPEEGLEILPPQKLADTEDHILAQQEGRRVWIYLPDGDGQFSISHGTVHHPGFKSVGLQISITGMQNVEVLRGYLIITAGDDTLSRTPLPSMKSKGDTLFSRNAFWSLPRDTRFIGDRLRIQGVLEMRDGSTVTTDMEELHIGIEDYEGSEWDIADMGGWDELKVREKDREQFSAWLGKGVRHEIPMRFTLTGFDFRSERLRTHHLEKIRVMADRFVAEGLNDPERQWRMHIRSDIETVESEEIPPAVFEGMAERAVIIDALAHGKVIDPDFHNVPVFFFEPGQTVDGRSDAVLYHIVHSMFGTEDWGIDYYGLGAGTVSPMFDPYDSRRYSEFSEPESQDLDVVRGQEVAKGVRTGFSAIPRFDSIKFTPGYFTPSLHPYPPEQRFDMRKVTITIYNDRSYLWYLDEMGRG